MTAPLYQLCFFLQSQMPELVIIYMALGVEWSIASGRLSFEANNLRKSRPFIVSGSAS